MNIQRMLDIRSKEKRYRFICKYYNTLEVLKEKIIQKKYQNELTNNIRVCETTDEPLSFSSQSRIPVTGDNGEIYDGHLPTIHIRIYIINRGEETYTVARSSWNRMPFSITVVTSEWLPASTSSCIVL